MNLTDRQKMFVKEYVVDFNATQAAIRAGYSEKTARAIASENLTKPYIMEAIQEEVAARNKRVEVSQDYVLKTITEVIERGLQHSPVLTKTGETVYTETPNGDEAAAYTFQAMAVLKGTEQLGKYLKMFTEKHEHTGKDGGPIETVEVSDLEAARAIYFMLNQGANEADKCH